MGPLTQVISCHGIYVDSKKGNKMVKHNATIIINITILRIEDFQPDEADPEARESIQLLCKMKNNKPIINKSIINI